MTSESRSANICYIKMGYPPSRLERSRKAGKQGPRQTEIEFHTWGGKRKNAGRRPARPGMTPHLRRPALASRFPVHVSLKVEEELPSLRQGSLPRVIEDCLRAGREAEGFRLAHYSIQRKHLHFIVEAAAAERLSRGMQGLSIRLAKRINKALGRKGRVFGDRYFERILKTPKQTRYCLQYVLMNASQCTSFLFRRNRKGQLLRGLHDSVVPARTRLLQDALSHLRPQQLVSAEYPRPPG